jgi:phosphoribosylanthranilate isomerase
VPAGLLSGQFWQQLTGMINGVRFKVCGITSLVDADFADACGADFLGFILYSKSARCVPLASYRAMSPLLPPRKRVAVTVSPSAADLTEYAAADFDCFQVHFPHDTPTPLIATWTGVVGKERLWLAPKLPPEREFMPAWLNYADTVLWDTYHAEGFGGSGQPGDWTRFAQAQKAWPLTRWILAGGLKPENIAEALKASKARFVDVNSGVESSPGVKDPAKLKAFVSALHGATKQSNPAYG